MNIKFSLYSIQNFILFYSVAVSPIAKMNIYRDITKMWEKDVQSTAVYCQTYSLNVFKFIFNIILLISHYF